MAGCVSLCKHKHSYINDKEDITVKVLGNNGKRGNILPQNLYEQKF